MTKNKVESTSAVVTTLKSLCGFVSVTVKLVDAKMVEAEMHNQGYGASHEQWLRDVYTAIGDMLEAVAHIREGV